LEYLKTNKVNVLKISILIFLVFFPFLNSDYGDNVIPEKITSDLAFYEINTCRISLLEFMAYNPNVAYQDHYKIRFNDYSSIRCFGTITGIDQIGHVFYISIGTNVFINLFLQTFFWLLVISLIKRKKEYEISFRLLLSSLISSLLFCFGIYSESRFYEKKLFEVDLSIFSTYFDIFIYLFFLNFLTLAVVDSRNKKIIQYLPFVFIIVGLYSGLNFYMFSLFFTTYGIHKIIENKKYLKLFNYSNLMLLIWCLLSIGNNYYLDPDKIRGLSNTSFNSNSLIFWTYFLVLFAIGVYDFSLEKRTYFSFENIYLKFLTSSVLIVILGYLSSSNPIFNFFSYYFFGLSKYGTDNQNLFAVDIWNTRIAWRGLFPSAETIGEFFAVVILIYFINIIDTKKIKLHTFLLVFPAVGLLASNNKAAVISLLFCIYLKLNNSFSIKRSYKTIFYFLASGTLIFFIGIENIGYSLQFTSKNFLNIGNDYILNEESSSLSFLNNLDNKPVARIIMLAIGQVAYFVNRSELWGIFLARYNPEYLNVFVGSGVFSLAKQYGEINLSKYKYATNIEMGFLLPHSSILLIFLFTGLIGLVLFLYFIAKQLINLRKYQYNNFLVILLLTVNILKSDSLIYMPWLLMYLTFNFVNKTNYQKKVKQ